MDLFSLKQTLEGLPIAEIRFYPSTGSTNEDALKWAVQGADDGSLVIADQQTSGRGRLGRKWVTNPGAALAFTLILRPTEKEKNHLSLFSPLGALAVSGTIRKYCQLSAQVKWPNDVLVNRKKICGVLAETQWTGNNLNGLALGIGINISPASIPVRTDLLFPATCLENEFNQSVDREKFLRGVVTEFFHLRKLLGSIEFLHLWEKQLAFKGETVQMEIPEKQKMDGILYGITELGNLVLLLADGEKVTFPIGEIKLRPKKQT
jgi:BirA family transcriptional regulator, biotin operon repressor / biotin---[acetyl-CoA-carboxylase] ligase